ncbi:MAG: hypothetical protein ACOCTT_01395, partial [archaeon]
MDSINSFTKKAIFLILAVALLTQISIASANRNEFLRESNNSLSDWSITVGHDYEGWHFESFPLADSVLVDIREDYCNASGDWEGSCDLVYYYNSSREEDPWMVWNRSKTDDENDITTLRVGMGYWVHVDSTGYSGEWEGSEIDPIRGDATWIKDNSGWNLRGWTSIDQKNLSSKTLPALNEEWGQNYTVQW